MSDDKADNNPAPEEEIATVADQEAQASSDPAPSQEDSQEDSAENKMTGLMAEDPEAPSPSAPKKPAVDLEAEAINAAQAAVAEGEKALADAQAELQERPAAKVKLQPKPNNRREVALRLLLAANILAMIVVSIMPSTGSDPVTVVSQPTTPPPVKENAITPTPIAPAAWSPAPATTGTRGPRVPAVRRRALCRSGAWWMRAARAAARAHCRRGAADAPGGRAGAGA